MVDDLGPAGGEIVLYETEDGRTRVECQAEGERAIRNALEAAATTLKRPSGPPRKT